MKDADEGQVVQGKVHEQGPEHVEGARREAENVSCKDEEPEGPQGL